MTGVGGERCQHHVQAAFIETPNGKELDTIEHQSKKGQVPTPVSVHARALATWLAIFPLVTIGLYALSPWSRNWSPIFSALLLTAVIVPLSVYLVVPKILAGHAAIDAWRRRRNDFRKPEQ